MQTTKSIAVDLTPLLPGGANGGVKPLILESLKVIQKQLKGKARFTYFTNSQTHGEIAEIANYRDRLVCVLPQNEYPAIKGLHLYTESCDHVDNPRLLLDYDIDILYCPFGSAQLACPGIPVISCIVDLLHRDFPASLPQQEIDHRENYMQHTMRVSDSLNCISQYVINRVKECYPEFDGEAFHTYNTIQNRLCDVTSIKPALPDTPYFYYPANYWIHKNHEGLLIAYQIYLKRTPSNPRALVLTGYEDDRAAEMKILAQTLGIADHVHFLGHVDNARLKAIWENCYALLFPSLHEGFGIPLLEAMHFGKPGICSDSCCLPEVGGNAFLYVNARRPEEIAQAMCKIHEDAPLVKDLGLLSHQRIQQFNFEHEILKLSERLLKTSAQRQWHSHIAGDGSFDELALISIPQTTGRNKLSIEISSPEQPATFTLFAGNLPLGTHRVETSAICKFEFWIRNPSGCLRIEANPLNNDTKGKGRLQAASLTTENGTTQTLVCFQNEI